MRIYLDHAASSPLRLRAREAMVQAFDVFGNASSIHVEGQRARFLVDVARRQVAEFVGVRAERVIFTSGGSESNNLALRGVMEKCPQKALLISAVEHDCVRVTAEKLGHVRVIPVNQDGVVDITWLADELHKYGPDIGLVSVMAVNNENGVVQPIKEIAELCKAAGVLLHSDCVQLSAHKAFDMDTLGADLITLSAHKMGGPKGVGALVVRPEIDMNALILGGGQERNRRAGTENVPAIAGFGAAAEEIACSNEWQRMDAVKALLVEKLHGVSVEIVAEASEAIGHIIQLMTPGKRGDEVVIAMDMQGVAISQGSACSSGRVLPSRVLQAMGYSVELAGEAVRISWGWSTTEAEIEYAANALAKTLA